MWQLIHTVAQRTEDHATTLQEMLRSTIRKLLYVTGLFWLISALIFSSEWGGERIMGLIIGIGVVGAIFAFAYWLVGRAYSLALVFWLIGLITAILFCSWLLQNNSVLLLSSVLPLIAVITVSHWAGVAMELLVIALVAGAVQGAWGTTLPAGQAIIVIIAGIFSGLLGWAARSELLTVTAWSISSFEQARRNLEEMREQQMELEQSREDLIQANRELLDFPIASISWSGLPKSRARPRQNSSPMSATSCAPRST